MDYFLNIIYELINHTKYISYRKYTNYKLINYYGYTPKKLYTRINSSWQTQFWMAVNIFFTKLCRMPGIDQKFIYSNDSNEIGLVLGFQKASKI